MKKLVSVLLVISTIYLAGDKVYAQAFTPNVTGTSMQDIYIAGAYLVDALEKADQEIVHLQYDIVAEKSTKSVYRELSSSWMYTIFGFSDFRVKDLDITVYKYIDGQWYFVDKDQLHDNYPTVTILPTSSGLYRFDITGYAFAKDYSSGHYGLFCYHKAP